MRSALRSAVSARSWPSIARRLRPGMRHRSNRRVAAPCACTARTCSSPSGDDSHKGWATRPSNSGSSATSQPPTGKGHHALASGPIRAVAGVATQVLPSEGWIVEVQHVQIGGGDPPRGMGKIFRGGCGHGILQQKGETCHRGKVTGWLFRRRHFARRAIEKGLCQSVVDRAVALRIG